MSDLIRVAGPARERRANVLLVHGLGGHHFDTWRCGTADTPWDADKTFWPLWLAHDCDNLAVYVICYDASVLGGRGTAMHFTDQADNILAILLTKPALARAPLIFIGHSLGGLLIKQLLRTADINALQDRRAADLIEHVEKVAFLATPHLGASLATWGDRLRILVRPSVATAALGRNDPNLHNLNHWYRTWANTRGIDHLILTETKPTSVLGMIVQPDSADPGFAKMQLVPIASDHIRICKPIDDKTDIYVLVRDFIKQPVERPKTKLDEIHDLLAAALGKNETLRAAEAGAGRQTILELARRLKPEEVLDLNQAAVEVTAVVDRAIEVMEKGARRSNLGDLVDAVLAGIAAKTRAGDIEGASKEADEGFAEWERAEAERHALSLHSGIALLEAGLRQDILRRDALVAAQRVKRIVALEHPDDASVRFAAMCKRGDAFDARGRDSRVNFDLLVAIEIARLALDSAGDAQQRGAALNNLGNALSALGERESDTARLEEAVTAHREALKERTRESAPLDWAASQNNLGLALTYLGERENSTRRLEEAITACRDALKEWTREREPLDWAMAQNNLGIALMRLGERESDTARLEEAVTAYRQALKVWTREHAPRAWAGAQNNLGSALVWLRECDSESDTARLEEAVTAYREALKVWTRERLPRDWAGAQNNLGIALMRLGERESNTARLEEAVTAHHEALKEWTRECLPRDWARAQFNLGIALATLGTRESGTTRLKEAVNAFREALTERTRERAPLDWAAARNNLGNALATLGARENDTARLEEAVTAHRETLKEWTRERAPHNWARAQYNLGNALTDLGARESGTTRLEEAVTAYREALKEWTRERAPRDWAIAQYKLGNALTELGARESGTTRLEEAVNAYREALKEWTRERVPRDWAMTQTNLGNALRRLGERESGPARLEEAVGAFREALKEPNREPSDWATTQNNLGIALATLAARESDTAGFEEAVTTYREALKEWTRERVPLKWAMTRGNEGVALMHLAERREDAAMAETALSQITTAFETMRDGGDTKAEYYESQLPKARAVVAQLSGRGASESQKTTPEMDR